MTIEVTGCHDCPLMSISGDLYWCDTIKKPVNDQALYCVMHPSCPLKQETITIKLKENDTTRN